MAPCIEIFQPAKKAQHEKPSEDSDIFFGKKTKMIHLTRVGRLFRTCLS